MYINPELFSTHPEKTATQKEMDSYLFLEENGVDYIRAEHDEAATIELCEEIEKVILEADALLPEEIKNGPRWQMIYLR